MRLLDAARRGFQSELNHELTGSVFGQLHIRSTRCEIEWNMHTTPPSLLERLRRPAEQAAWPQFVKLYTPLLCHWSRRLGLRDGEVEDFVQDLFVMLVRKLPEFNYQPSQRFRGW